MFAPVFVSSHPLVLHHLAKLRHKDTQPAEFRDLVREISQSLFYEALKDITLRRVSVPTPLMTTECQELADRIGLVPVLRAGLGMADALLQALPTASVWHLGLYRDHTTLKPVTYYNKLPLNHGLDVGLVLDPMLATGGSANEAINILKRAGVPRIKFIGLIAAPAGVKALQDAHPDVPLYLAAVDSHLNNNSYIVPGLGDAGDRQFGTC
jgi:uracil phosphoribosyltransferase